MEGINDQYIHSFFFPATEYRKKWIAFDVLSLMNLARTSGLFVWDRPLVRCGRGGLPHARRERGDVVFVARRKIWMRRKLKGRTKKRERKKRSLCRNELHRLSRLWDEPYCKNVCQRCLLLFPPFWSRFVCLLPTGAIILMNGRRWNSRDWTQKQLY